MFSWFANRTQSDEHSAVPEYSADCVCKRLEVMVNAAKDIQARFKDSVDDTNNNYDVTLLQLCGLVLSLATEFQRYVKQNQIEHNQNEHNQRGEMSNG